MGAVLDVNHRDHYWPAGASMRASDGSGSSRVVSGDSIFIRVVSG